MGWLCTVALSDAIPWDADPPIISGLRHFDSVSQTFRALTDHSCGFGEDDCINDVIEDCPPPKLHECKDRYFTNLTYDISFEIDLRDRRSGGIHFAMWALSSELVYDLDARLDWQTLGNDEMLRGATTEGVTMTYSSSTVPEGVLTDKATVYLHVYLHCLEPFRCGLFACCAPLSGLPSHSCSMTLPLHH